MLNGATKNCKSQEDKSGMLGTKSSKKTTTKTGTIGETQNTMGKYLILFLRLRSCILHSIL